jgi:hypothetical protein
VRVEPSDRNAGISRSWSEDLSFGALEGFEGNGEFLVASKRSFVDDRHEVLVREIQLSQQRSHVFARRFRGFGGDFLCGSGLAMLVAFAATGRRNLAHAPVAFGILFTTDVSHVLPLHTETLLEFSDDFDEIGLVGHHLLDRLVGTGDLIEHG